MTSAAKNVVNSREMSSSAQMELQTDRGRCSCIFDDLSSGKLSKNFQGPRQKNIFSWISKGSSNVDTEKSHFFRRPFCTFRNYAASLQIGFCCTSGKICWRPPSQCRPRRRSNDGDSGEGGGRQWAMASRMNRRRKKSSQSRRPAKWDDEKKERFSSSPSRNTWDPRRLQWQNSSTPE